MGEKPTEADEQSYVALRAEETNGAGLAAAPVAALPQASAEPPPDDDYEAIAASEDEQQPVRFAYVCYHCGAHREVDSQGYVSDCLSCGQSRESGQAQMEAVARGEHIPTYDRTSPYYP